MVLWGVSQVRIYSCDIYLWSLIWLEYRQSWDSVSNIESLEGPCCLGALLRYSAYTKYHFVPQGPRAQIDRKLYKRHMQDELHNYMNLSIRAASVFDLVFDHPEPATSTSWGKAVGVKLGKGESCTLAGKLTYAHLQSPEKLSPVPKSSSVQGLSFLAKSISVSIVIPPLPDVRLMMEGPY
jgi:hypothetical protein